MFDALYAGDFWTIGRVARASVSTVLCVKVWWISKKSKPPRTKGANSMAPIFVNGCCAKKQRAAAAQRAQVMWEAVGIDTRILTGNPIHHNRGQRSDLGVGVDTWLRRAALGQSVTGWSMVRLQKRPPHGGGPGAARSGEVQRTNF
jgi:hypothetical protein